MTWGYSFCEMFVDDTDPVDFPSLPGIEFAWTKNRRPYPEQPDPADFTTWPTLVEIFTTDEQDNPAIVGAAADLLRQVWAAGRRAVIAADFEEELPWAGGIQRVEGIT
jgi:hypothetical protein